MSRSAGWISTRRLGVTALAAGIVAALLLAGPAPSVKAFQPYYPYACPLGTAGRDLNGNNFDWLLSWNPATGFFRLGDISDDLTTQWGTWGDIPVAGDFDGDTFDDIGVFRPSNGTWYVKGCDGTGCSGSVRIISWGTAGDLPVPADYDHDGYADYGVWRPSTGEWFVKSGANPATMLVAGVQWGTYGDCPLPGRIAGVGAGELELNVWRPANGVWYYGKSLAGTGGSTTQFGTYGDIPFVVDSDVDGDGDIVVWRPSNGTWYGSVPSFQIQWGTAGDIPLVRSGETGISASLLTVVRPTNHEIYSCYGPAASGCNLTSSRSTSAAWGEVFLNGGPK